MNISNELLLGLIQYLRTKPYNEVFQLLKLLENEAIADAAKEKLSAATSDPPKTE